MFALTTLAEYLALFSLTILLMGLRHDSASAMQSKVKCFLYPLHLLYMACFAIGMTNQLGASCTSSTSLPIIFYCKDGCFLLYFVLLLALNRQNYLIEWTKPGNDTDEVKQKQTATKAGEENAKKDKSHELVKIAREEKLFKF